MFALNIYKKLFPPFLKKSIDPETERIRNFVITCSAEMKIGDTILDAGAGECQYKSLFSKYKYMSIDSSCGDAAWDYSKLDFVGDLEKLPFDDNTIDFVLCTQVLEHVRNPQAVLNEFHRVLKKKGGLFLTAPQGWGVHQIPHDYFRFTNYGLQHLLEKAGFNINSIKPSCGYFGYLANRLTIFPKTLFWQIKSKWARYSLLPLELLSYLFFVLIFPIFLNMIDFLDREKKFTLNYFVKAFK